jgi:transcriptional regulator with XRE-family HTH domain
MVAIAGFGPQLRSWRLARHLSQEALAARAEISSRHLNFVENGRSNPSRELVLTLSDALDIPLRDRNALLTLAGYAAVYRASSLDGAELRHLRRAIEHVLRQQEPFGAFVVNGRWDVVDANAGALRLMAQFPPKTAAGAAASRNILLASLHPEALRPYIVNWLEVAGLLVARLHRELAAMPSEETHRLLAAALAMPDVPATWRTPAPGQSTEPFVTVHLRSETLELQLFSMLTSIGTPLDVTAEELRIETYFPADEASEKVLRELAAGAGGGGGGGEKMR